MPTTLRVSFARWCRKSRVDLDVTQQALAEAVGVSRSYIAEIEGGRANPSLELADRIAEALGIRFEVVAIQPQRISGLERDIVHARCSAYVHRRLIGAGWLVEREVEVVEARAHGWIDLLAFDPRTRTLLIIEIKTAIDDVGRLERQLSWYERLAVTTNVVGIWQPQHVRCWALVLASADVDEAIARHRDLLAYAFPVRAASMSRLLQTGPDDPGGRGIALIDPASRRRRWLLPSRSDGRRSPAPYQDRAGAARIWTRRVR